MGILAPYRGQGIGRRLLQAALQSAQAKGLIKIDLEVFASNHAAIALYERAGFIREGCRRRARHLDGIWDDVLLLTLLPLLASRPYPHQDQTE
jgi:ribosomal protein S18 acetylase RimI-like enzyme